MKNRRGLVATMSTYQLSLFLGFFVHLNGVVALPSRAIQDGPATVDDGVQQQAFGESNSHHSDDTAGKTPQPGWTHPWQLAPSERRRPHAWPHVKSSEEARIKTLRDRHDTEVQASTLMELEDHADKSLLDDFDSVDHSGMIRRLQKTATLADKAEMMSKYWNSIYKSIPFGRSQRSNDPIPEFDLGHFRLRGMPTGRGNPSKEKEYIVKQKAELRLPIPDSEIPSPGHYRQPLNRSQMKMVHSHADRVQAIIEKTKQRANVGSKSANVEAFTMLVEVIKALQQIDLSNFDTKPPWMVYADGDNLENSI